MKNLKVGLGWGLLLMVLMISCSQEEQEVTNIDQVLEDALKTASQGAGLSYYKMPEAGQLDQIPQDPRNKLTEAKIKLGMFLYHEPSLGLDPELQAGAGTYSCASCHHAGAGFQAGLKQGIGEGGIGFGQKGESRIRDPEYTNKALDVQPIRSPSTLNVAYQPNMLWNGQFGATGVNQGTEFAWLENTPRKDNFLGFEGVETQAMAGMDTHRMLIGNFFVEDIRAYKPLFDAAFPEVPEAERCNRVNAGLAIAAYERSLLANQAPFQRWLRGEVGAMDTDEKQGAILFFGKAECYQCHNGPALNSMAFYGLGMKDLYEAGDEIVNSSKFSLENKGRGGFTGMAEDMYRFKVPQLYNLKDAGFLGHGASFATVYEVVKYKNEAVPENAQVPEGSISTLFHPLELTEQEMNQITAFLEDGLYDPDLFRYVPEELPSGQCFPNNDVRSRRDLGCE
ncbi:MAG: cytochrome-c peroxidase [Candidatus Cyclobacteriaceae bacterium M3_2C_046]